MNEIILGVLALVGGALSGMGAQWAKDRADLRRAGTEVSGEVHKADLESDAQFMDRLIKRVEHLEERLLENEKTTRGQDGAIANLELKLERVGNQYEANRKLQKRVGHRLREGKPIDDETLLELENSPEFERVLRGPQGGRSLPPSAP